MLQLTYITPWWMAIQWLGMRTSVCLCLKDLRYSACVKLLSFVFFINFWGLGGGGNGRFCYHSLVEYLYIIFEQVSSDGLDCIGRKNFGLLYIWIPKKLLRKSISEAAWAAPLGLKWWWQAFHGKILYWLGRFEVKYEKEREEHLWSLVRAQLFIWICT